MASCARGRTNFGMDFVMPMWHISEMSIIREYRRRSGLSQQTVAKLLGTTQSEISRMEHGQRAITLDDARMLADVIGIPIEAMLADSGGHTTATVTKRPATPSKPPKQDGGLIPIRAAKTLGQNGEITLFPQPVDWAQRPDYLGNAKDPYALYVAGDAMMPRYRSGQLLYINAHKPPAPGAGVVVLQADGTIVLGEFIARSANTVTLQSHNPARTFDVQAADVHTVAGLQEG